MRGKDVNFYIHSILSFIVLFIYLVSFLLSEHILRKEIIVIVKKFDFEILTYLYVLRSPEFIDAIFTVMFVCVYVSERDSI